VYRRFNCTAKSLYHCALPGKLKKCDNLILHAHGMSLHKTHRNTGTKTAEINYSISLFIQA